MASPRPLLAGSSLLALALLPGIASAGDTWTKPYAGVDYLYRTNAVPQQIHVLKIDLTRRDIRLRATKSGERGQKPSTWASGRGCEAAINGDYFSFSTYATTGLAMGDGKKWPESKDGPGQGFIAAGKDNRVEISKPSAVVTDLPGWYWEVVGGRNPLVFDGIRTDYPDCASNPHCVRHPRTAVGLDKTGDVLFLVVVDGRSSASKGMDLNELGKLMLNLGSDRALNLDGGGSSAMWIKGQGVVSEPSDGSERVVANHLCVDKVKPVGDLEGYVEEAGTSKALQGAVVTLPSGKKTTTNAKGFYSFLGIPAGDRIVEASHAGHQGAQKTTYVVAADVTKLSFKLKPEASSGGTEGSSAGAGGAGGAGSGAGGAGVGGNTGTGTSGGPGGSGAEEALGGGTGAPGAGGLEDGELGDEPEGCSCRTASGPLRASGGALALGLAALLALGRRAPIRERSTPRSGRGSR